MAVLGKFKVGKSVALGIATGIATLGMVSVMTTPVQQPVVLTTKRFLVLGIKQGIVDQPDSKIVTAVPRSELRMKFAFNAMSDAKAFASGLGAPAVAAASR